MINFDIKFNFSLYSCHHVYFLFQRKNELSLKITRKINHPLYPYKKKQKCENNKYQQVTRWWHGENREKTITYLDEEFKLFAQILDKILYNLKDKHLLKYYTLALDVVKYINEIIPGLYSLKETYTNCKEIQSKVDSIITTFIDYKDQIEKYKDKEHNRRIQMKHLAIRRI